MSASDLSSHHRIFDPSTLLLINLIIHFPPLTQQATRSPPSRKTNPALFLHSSLAMSTSSQYSSYYDPQFQQRQQPLQQQQQQQQQYQDVPLDSASPPNPSVRMMLEHKTPLDYEIADASSSISSSFYKQKEKRTRFMVRLAVILRRLRKWEEQNDDFSSISTRSHVLTRKVKMIVRYATQRNRMGDPKYTPLVDSIEHCLKQLLGVQEWFSVCVEAEQRSRVRQLSQMVLGSSTTFTNSTASSTLPPSDFVASFFP